jgi:hypothetical protein
MKAISIFMDGLCIGKEEIIQIEDSGGLLKCRAGEWAKMTGKWGKGLKGFGTDIWEVEGFDGQKRGLADLCDENRLILKHPGWNLAF